MKIVALGDLHCQLDLVTEPADALVIAGDLTWRGTINELTKVREWLKKQPQKHKIIIAGNHDWCFDNARRQEAEVMMGGDGIVYLRDQSVTIDGIKFYGSPWQPWFHDWAFNLYRGKPLAEKWALIPDDVDVLVVHGPPFGYGDRVHSGDRVGCEDLVKAIKVKQPRVAVYGHIHEDPGQWTLGPSKLINCSVGPDFWRTRSKEPVTFELEPR
jgi:Icc-related predicted phosphoesterase